MNSPDSWEDEYVKMGGGYCPFCKSDDITYDFMSDFDEGTTEVVHCKKCGKHWKEVNFLVLMEVFEVDENGDELQEYDVSLDGDATSALASAGFGTDEDYGG